MAALDVDKLMFKPYLVGPAGGVRDTLVIAISHETTRLKMLDGDGRVEHRPSQSIELLNLTRTVANARTIVDTLRLDDNLELSFEAADASKYGETLQAASEIVADECVDLQRRFDVLTRVLNTLMYLRRGGPSGEAKDLPINLDIYSILDSDEKLSETESEKVFEAISDTISEYVGKDLTTNPTELKDSMRQDLEAAIIKALPEQFTAGSLRINMDEMLTILKKANDLAEGAEGEGV